VNATHASVQVCGGMPRAVSFQDPLPVHSIGVPSELQPVNAEEITQDRDNSLSVPVRFVLYDLIAIGLRFTT